MSWVKLWSEKLWSEKLWSEKLWSEAMDFVKTFFLEKLSLIAHIRLGANFEVNS